MNASHNWKDQQYAAINPDRLADALATAGRDVLRGLFGPDYGLPAYIIETYLAGNDTNVVSADAILKEKLVHHIDQRKLPILRNLEGRILTIDDFPKTGNELTDDCAIPIVERLRQRLLENPSGGGIAECFEHHIHYGLGTSQKLSDAQRRYIVSVCALANRRPHSTIWLGRFVLECLETPQRIRNLLTVIAQYRLTYLPSLRNAFAANFEKLEQARRKSWLPFRRRPLHLLVVGYSHSVLEGIWGLAAQSSDPISVSIADVRQTDRWPAPTEALFGMLGQNSKLQVVNERVPLAAKAIARKQIDYVITGAKALYLCGAGKNVKFVVSSPCAEAIEVAGDTPIIVASGLSKIWAAALYKIYQQHIDAPVLIGHDNKVLAKERVAMIGCESGVYGAEEFLDQDLHRALFSAADIEMFYALLAPDKESETYQNLLSAALAEEKNANALRTMANPGTPLEGPPSSEMLALLSKYTEDATEQVAQFSAAKAALGGLIEQNEAWYLENQNKYIAIIDAKSNRQYVSLSFWDALKTAYDRWPDEMFYVGKIRRPLPPDKLVLRQVNR